MGVAGKPALSRLFEALQGRGSKVGAQKPTPRPKPEGFFLNLSICLLVYNLRSKIFRFSEAVMLAIHVVQSRIRVSPIWFAMLLTAFSSSCDSGRSTRVVGPTGTPTLTGRWKGTVTAVYVSATDTLSVRNYNVRITFDDSTFTYRYVDNYGATIPPYVGAGKCTREDTRIYLDDTTTYSDWVDRSTTPIIGEPYSLNLSNTAATLLWTHNYDQALIRSQSFDLIRDK